MSITFEVFPSYYRASITAVEMKARKRSLSGDYIPQKVLIVGQYDQSKTITAGTIKQFLSVDEVAAEYGYGSEIHRQALWIYSERGSTDEIYCCPVAEADSSVEATGTVTFANDATSAGSWYIMIGGNLYQINVKTGDTATEQGAALVSAITSDIDAPYSAVNASGVVTITASNAGANGNYISIKSNPSGSTQSENNPSGSTIALSGSYLTGGSGDPDVSAVFTNSSGDDNLGDTWFTFITCPYQDATALALYKAAGKSRLAPGVNKPFASIVGYTTQTYATVYALPATYNAECLAPVWDPRVFAPPCEFAADITGVVTSAAIADPGRPFKTLALSVPYDSSVLDISYANLDTLYRAGCGYCKAPASTLILGDLALSYRTNDAGGSSASWYDLVSMTMRQQKVYSIIELFAQDKYVRGMVSDDSAITNKDYVIKPKTVVADLYALVDVWASEGWTKNVSTVKASISAEINSSYNSRIDSTMVDDPAQALRILAMKYCYLTD